MLNSSDKLIIFVAMSTGICMIECCNRAMQLRFKLEPDKDVTVNDLLQMARAKTDCVLVAKWNNLVMEDDAIYSPHYPITLHCQCKFPFYISRYIQSF